MVTSQCSSPVDPDLPKCWKIMALIKNQNGIIVYLKFVPKKYSPNPVMKEPQTNPNWGTLLQVNQPVCFKNANNFFIFF